MRGSGGAPGGAHVADLPAPRTWRDLLRPGANFGMCAVTSAPAKSGWMPEAGREGMEGKAACVVLAGGLNVLGRAVLEQLPLGARGLLMQHELVHRRDRVARRPERGAMPSHLRE